MTLEELDEALKKLGLNIESDDGKVIRDNIISDYGAYLIKSKIARCSRCWHLEKEHSCFELCDLYSLPETPLEAGKWSISNANDLDLIQFICLFVVPIYERLTGQKNVLDDISNDFKRRFRIQERRRMKSQKSNDNIPIKIVNNRNM